MTSFAYKAAQPVNTQPQVEQPKATVVSQPNDTATKPQGVDPTKSAVSGGSAFQASGLIGTVPSSPTTLYDSGAKNARQGMGNEYNIMNALDQRTQILNDEMDAKVASYNQRAQRNNSSITGAYSDQYDVGGDSGLDAEQMNMAQHIASVGKQRGMDDNAIQIALMTALTESGLRNLNYGDRDSVGLFQQRTSQGWGSVQQIMDPTYSANKFYDALGKVNYKGMNPWAAAQAVQRSFDPTGSNYQVQWAKAQQAFKALTPKQQAAVTGSNDAAGWINANNNKYLDYDGRYGAQCVDLYNFYVSKFVGGDPMMGRVGYAQDIFNNYDSRVMTRFGNNVSGRMGDVAVFRAGGGTPSSHVAIVVGDNGNGTLRVLQANATSAGSAGNTIISNISKATLMGYLRPNRLGA